MLYLVIAHDGSDAAALERRLGAREAHLGAARRLHEDGVLHVGGAILDAESRMIGSVLLIEAEDEAELQSLLEADPYRRHDVWRRFEIWPFRRAF